MLEVLSPHLEGGGQISVVVAILVVLVPSFARLLSEIYPMRPRSEVVKAMSRLVAPISVLSVISSLLLARGRVIPFMRAPPKPVLAS